MRFRRRRRELARRPALEIMREATALRNEMRITSNVPVSAPPAASRPAWLRVSVSVLLAFGGEEQFDQADLERVGDSLERRQRRGVLAGFDGLEVEAEAGLFAESALAQSACLAAAPDCSAERDLDRWPGWHHRRHRTGFQGVGHAEH